MDKIIDITGLKKSFVSLEAVKEINFYVENHYLPF